MSETKNKGGRPRVNATPVTLRLPPELIGKLDRLRERQSPIPSRPEAIRQVLDATFKAMGPEEDWE